MDFSPPSLMTAKELMLLVGKQISRRRKVLGLSRQNLAIKSGVSVATLGRLEREGVATLQVLAKLAIALDSVDSVAALFHSPTVKTYEELKKLEELG